MTDNPNWRVRYRVEVDWQSLAQHTDNLEGVPDDVESLQFRRDKSSHRGISRLRHLRQLVAFCVNQEFLEEISELPKLETLYISQTTATDFRCVGRCRTLCHLTIKGGGKVSSLAWIEDLPPLRS